MTAVKGVWRAAWSWVAFLGEVPWLIRSACVLMGLLMAAATWRLVRGSR